MLVRTVMQIVMLVRTVMQVRIVMLVRTVIQVRILMLVRTVMHYYCKSGILSILIPILSWYTMVAGKSKSIIMHTMSKQDAR